ncbi:MAG: Two component regulator, sensor protein [Pedosphaera sp.]|nr:Two component regulator, sensor protein [Pedosphaera sp.]
MSRLNDGGVFNYNWENQPTHGLSTDLILALFEDRDGSLLVGTDYEGGTFRFNEGTFSRVWSPEQSLIDRVIRVIYRDREGNLWFGASPGLVLWDQHQKFLPDSVIRCLTEDHAGSLWVGTQDGLYCRKDGNFFNWSDKENQLHGLITSLYEDHEGNLWIGTGSSGLSRYRDGRLTTYSVKQGLFSEDVFEILEDDHRCLWLSCSRGIFRVSKQNLDDLDRRKCEKITSIAYGKADGMESVQCNGVAKPAGWKGRDGRLWFATAKGVVVTDPNLELGSNERPPPVLVEEVLADKKPVAFKAGTGAPPAIAEPKLRISPGRGDLEFHYTALTFQAPEKACFRYKLEGADLEWTEVTRRVAYYNNLAPGNYRFRVKACNNDGVWNEAGASVALVLLPHFWQTWWFVTSGALFAVAVAGGTVRYTTRRNMEQELQRLEKQNAVEEERIRIARDMHDEIGAKLTKISFLGAMAKRKLLQPEEAGSQIDKMSETAREVIRALDEIVWAVNPANDTLEHLATYLCRNATEFFENSPASCQFKIPHELPACRLGTDVRHNILLAAKEAMNNVLKHAGATNVVMQISVQPDKFEVVIADNGRGFQREPGPGATGTPRSMRVGSGLTNMQQRLAAIGGRCEVESSAGQGTRIVFTVLL